MKVNNCIDSTFIFVDMFFCERWNCVTILFKWSLSV
jgi:hypothetical protein